jgi:hypothetical protein
MRFIGWMMDIARDQSPRADWLVETCERSRAAGYNALGLYLEHRYAYPSAPWAAADGALTPDVAKSLVNKFQANGLRIIPFLNTLGHMEGFIRSEGGQWLAEGSLGWSLQMCPTRPECIAFARGLVEDAMHVFDDEWMHLGGDETRLLGHCPLCAAREITKGARFGEYYSDLCRFVLERGRRPCLWGDMLLHHPEAMDFIPRQTLIFDWQYFNRPRESTAKFRAAGFDVVCCPSVQTYNAGWCFLGATQQNIDDHADDARELGALGVLVTTWEFTYFSSYAAIMPVIYSAARRLSHGATWRQTLLHEGPAYTVAAEILGNQIPAASAAIGPGTWRLLRDRLVIRQNPFELWRAWRSDACGPAGDAILRLCGEALAAQDQLSQIERWELSLPIKLHRVAVLWVREVEAASRHYAARDSAACVASLQSGEAILDSLRPYLASVAEAGGSRADLSRLHRLIERVRAVIGRIEATPANSKWRPAFETLVSDRYIAGDQANWLTGDLPPYKPD